MNTEDDEFARIAREQALNKMADNARELGLDYEPEIPFGDNNPGLQWDEVPQAFNDWWDSAYDPTGNPFGKDTHAYWAWAGWKAAKQPAQQVLTPWSKALEDVWAEPDEASPPAQQEPVEFKCIVIDNHHSNGIPFEQWVKPTQRTWVGLTDEEREAIAVECGAMSADWLLFMEAVEQALKEKNV